MNLSPEVKGIFDTFDDKFEELVQALLYEDITADDLKEYFGPTLLTMYLSKRLKEKEDS